MDYRPLTRLDVAGNTALEGLASPGIANSMRGGAARSQRGDTRRLVGRSPALDLKERAGFGSMCLSAHRRVE